MNIEKINSKFRQFGQFIVNHRLMVFAFFIALLVFSIAGLKRIYFETSFDTYFVSDDPMLLKTDEFKSIFGNDYYVAVLVEDKDGLFTKKNLSLIRDLSNELMDSLAYAEKITSLTDLEFMVGTEDGMELQQIVPEEIPDDQAGLDAIRAKAYSKDYVSKKLVSRDGTMSWILVKLRPYPADSLWRAEGIEAPENQTGREAINICFKDKYASLNPNIAGMPYMSYAKAQYIQKEMARLMMIAIIVSLIVMALVTRSLRGVLIPVATSICALIIAMGIIGWLGLYLDMSTTLITVMLAFAVAIAYNIHVYSFFRAQLLKLHDRKQAAIDAIAETAWPVIFSGFTTIAAMMTFLAMNIVPMKAMGINSSLAIISVLISILVLTPITLSLGKRTAANKEFDSSFEGKSASFFDRFGEFVLRHSKKNIIITCFITAFCAVGVYWIEPAFDVERSMGRKVEYSRRFLELCETELGTMYSYDLMVVLPEEGDAKKPENLTKLEVLEHEIEGYQLTKRHSSVLDIIKDMNCTLNSGDTAFYHVPDNSEAVAQLLLLYENAGGSESEYWMDYEYRRLRLQIEIDNYNSNEIDIEMNRLEDRAKELFPEAEVSIVGNVPQFTVMQQYLTKGQMWSLVLSAVIIGVLLMIVFGNVRLGLIGMIPNLAPAVFVGGLMGWLGYPLDMMTACIIPMILGLAVDDTIHFVNHAHLEFHRQKNYSHAVRATFRVAGLAIVMTTIIICATFLGFSVSDAIQFAHFGTLAVAGLASALLADLFITPALFKLLKIFGKEDSNS
ncbi:MAG: MMPL family transporter [Bacteroidales bacterium]|nr:MMPL family transporter [Bacteroidales bacterium]